MEAIREAAIEEQGMVKLLMVLVELVEVSLDLLKTICWNVVILSSMLVMELWCLSMMLDQVWSGVNTCSTC